MLIIARSTVKVKSAMLHKRVCSPPSSRHWTRRWRTTNVCDAWPVRRQTYGYLPSCKASPPIGWYQIILLGDRGTCVLTTCPGLHSLAERLGFEPATDWSQVRQLTATPPSHTGPRGESQIWVRWVMSQMWMSGYDLILHWHWYDIWRLLVRNLTTLSADVGTVSRAWHR